MLKAILLSGGVGYNVIVENLSHSRVTVFDRVGNHRQKIILFIRMFEMKKTLVVFLKCQKSNKFR